MKQHPPHGYITEPEWFSARETIRELTSIRMWAEFAALASVAALIFFVFVAG